MCHTLFSVFIKNRLLFFVQRSALTFLTTERLSHAISIQPTRGVPKECLKRWYLPGNSFVAADGRKICRIKIIDYIIDHSIKARDAG